MAEFRFLCGAVEPFIAWELPGWLERRSIDTANAVTVEVLHPDREMDGSCRWCGGRKDEVVTVHAGRLV